MKRSGTRYDVIVAGAGPAGCAAAIAARKAGARVLLLDRDREPRDRPGETLHPGIEPLLAELGAAEALASATLLRHEGHWVRSGASRRFERFGSDGRGVWRGFQANRALLDAGLRSCAVGTGVELRTPVGVSDARRNREGRVIGVVTSAGENLSADAVIDAAGGRHWLARRLGIGVRRLSPRYVVTYGYVFESGLAPDSAEPEFRGDRRGWTWIAPVAPGRWQWTRLDFKGRRMASDWIPPELRGFVPSGPSRGADMTWRMARAAAGPGWFLAGDAAAVLDPASSHGVLRAVLTGAQAGRLAMDQSPVGWAAYHAWLRIAVEAEAAALRTLYARWSEPPRILQRSPLPLSL